MVFFSRGNSAQSILPVFLPQQHPNLIYYYIINYFITNTAVILDATIFVLLKTTPYQLQPPPPIPRKIFSIYATAADGVMDVYIRVQHATLWRVTCYDNSNNTIIIRMYILLATLLISSSSSSIYIHGTLTMSA